MDFEELEIIRFFRCLNTHNVKYLLVGGFAVNVHGFNRSTGDLDLWIADSVENRIPFVKALNEYGIEGAEIFHTLPFVAGYTEIVLDNGFPIDVMSDLQFFKQDRFKNCYENATEFKIATDVWIRVFQLSSLIEEKEKSERPKDKLDADTLKRLHRL